MTHIVTDTAATTLNWIPDVNKYRLAKPPDWFLKQMWDLDAALVILPSRNRQVYLLGRRRELSQRVPMLVEQFKKDTAADPRSKGLDADLIASSNLVMVDTIGGNVRGSWSPLLLQALKERDMWGTGGVDAYIAQMEAREQKAADLKRTQLLDDIDHRARDAWRSYQARTGERNQRGTGRKPGARVVKSSLSRPSSRTVTANGFSVDVGFAK